MVPEGYARTPRERHARSTDAELAPTAARPHRAAAGSSPPISLTLVLGLTCCAVGLVVGVLALGLLVSLRRSAEIGSHGTSERHQAPKALPPRA